MTLTQEKYGFNATTLAHLSRAEPAFSADLRRAAFEIFQSLPMPSKEDEAWRRTDISRLDLARYDFAIAPTAVASREKQGVVFEDLATAARNRPDLVEKYLGQAVPARRGKFEALNAAFWNQGLLLHVPKNTDVALPLFGGYGADLADGQAVLPRTLIVLEDGARATFFDQYASPDVAEGQALSCGAVEIFLGANAELRYVNLQRWGRGVNHFLTQGARLGAGAKLFTLAIALGGKMSKVNLGSELLGQGAESLLYGLVFGDADQRFTHHTVQDHRVPNTSSDLLFKAAVKDKSRSAYTGMIHITPEAQKTAAFQTSRNLILSDTAKADTIPMLEILADDVKCGHGASVGSLDEDQRFYLMTRGLSRQDAERVIVEGFFEEVLQKVPVEGTREMLHAAINQKLGVA